MTRRALPPTWRVGLGMILLTLIAATVYSILSTPAPANPVPSFTPVQLPTLEVTP